MVLILKLMYNTFKNIDEEYRDRRSENYPVLGSPALVLSMTIFYYIFVKNLGPKLMENHKPFELKKSILLYNLLQVLINSYLVLRSLYAIVWEFPHLSIACTWPDKDYTPKGQLELHLCYCYFLLKLFDYTDTIFMVLRKRNNQISFLHVYHHIMVCLGTFAGMRYLPGGHGIAFGIVNALVHAIMYSYYFISALRPKMKNSLWWKKHITQAQILQFLYLTVHFSRPLLQKNCDYPKLPATIGLTQCLTMLLLFGDFYRRTYFKKSIE